MIYIIAIMCKHLIICVLDYLDELKTCLFFLIKKITMMKIKNDLLLAKMYS